jgi:hypothetical protein
MIHLLWSKWRGSSRINWVKSATGSRRSRGTSFSYGVRANGARGSDLIPATCCHVCQAGQCASRRPCIANTCRRGTITTYKDVNSIPSLAVFTVSKSMQQSPSWETNSHSAGQKFPHPSLKLCSEDLTTGSYPVPEESTSHPHNLFL